MSLSQGDLELTDADQKPGAGRAVFAAVAKFLRPRRASTHAPQFPEPETATKAKPGEVLELDAGNYKKVITDTRRDVVVEFYNPDVILFF
jgi:hypothetical protein